LRQHRERRDNGLERQANTIKREKGCFSCKIELFCHPNPKRKLLFPLNLPKSVAGAMYSNYSSLKAHFFTLCIIDVRRRSGYQTLDLHVWSDH